MGWGTCQGKGELTNQDEGFQPPLPLASATSARAPPIPSHVNTVVTAMHQFAQPVKAAFKDAEMGLISPLFYLLFSLALVSGQFQTGRMPFKDLPEEGRRTRQDRSVSPTMMKVLDFSADVDGEADSNGEFTGATLDAGTLPESFTICLAIMTEAWTTEFSAARTVMMLNDNGDRWGDLLVWGAYNFTDHRVYMYNGTLVLRVQLKTQFFPLKWTHTCVSLDSNKITMVVDGQLLGEAEYRREEDKDRPTNLTLLLGRDPRGQEYSVRTTDLNVFNSVLPPERMIELTRAGGKECASPGDLVSWEEAEWTLHSQAKMIEVDREWEGPCRKESQVHLFGSPSAEFRYQIDCMEHCKKIVDGRTPPVNTEEDWDNLTREIELITQDRSNWPWMWLSATNGDFPLRKLATLDHWPETEVVNNETKKLEAAETIWRDFYTGQRLDNWTKPYFARKDSSDNTELCL